MLFAVSLPVARRIITASFVLVAIVSMAVLAFDSPTVSGVADPVIAGAGDIACPASAGPYTSCRAYGTSNLLVSLNPTAVFALGDTQYESGALADFQAVYDPTWGRLKSITHPAVGNHEYLTTNASGYFSYFGAAAGDPSKGYYSYNIGAWHIVVLNSQCANVGGCGLGSPQESWLGSDLTANPTKCIAAMWHQPRWSSGMFGNELLYSQFFTDLYNAHADIVLSGHDHDYERFALQDPNGVADPNGVRQFVVGVGGSNFTALGPLQPNSQIAQDTTMGILALTLHAASYDWQFIPAAGGTFTDSGTQACHNVVIPPTPTSANTTAPTRTATPTKTPTRTPTLPSAVVTATAEAFKRLAPQLFLPMLLK